MRGPVIIVTNKFCMIPTVVVSTLTTGMTVPAMTVWFGVIMREWVVVT